MEINGTTFYICDFKKRMEQIEDGDENILFSGPLGSVICDILSLDYVEIAKTITNILLDAMTGRKDFPEISIRNTLGSLLHYTGMRNITLIVKYAENIYCSKEKEIFKKEYGSIKNAFFETIYDRFRCEILLQAYIKESEQNSNMRVPRNFERFINACFEMPVLKQDLGISLSPSELSYITPKSDVRAIVSEMYSNLMNFSDDYIVMETTQLINFLVSAVYYNFVNGYHFKVCRNCNRLFIPFSRADELYCDNPSPQDPSRTCKQYGSEKLWYERLKHDEAAKLSRNVYMAKQMLVKRNPDIPEYKAMFEHFKEERKKWERAVKDGKRTKQEYIDWLNKMKSMKTLKK